MKVGILTFHWANNYGAVIQAYALLSKLKELGHDAYIIDRQRQYEGIARKLYHRFSYNHHFSWIKFHKDTNTFLTPTTKRYNTHAQLVEGFPQEKFDAVIVGSDQVWRWKIIGNNYFLDFISDEKTKRISYAASFGINEWNGSEEDRKTISALLKKFNNVSVREESGIEICRNTFGVEAQLVLDPTLLHTREFYEKTILKNHPAQNNKKIVSYILGNNQNKKQVVEIANLAKKMNLGHNELYWTAIDHPSLIGKSQLHTTHITPTEWINEIRNAEYIITNSFHATVFSILFQKQFVVLAHEGGGRNRLETLFNSLGINGRIVSTVEEAAKILNNEIDYKVVAANHKKLMDKSIEYLNNSL